MSTDKVTTNFGPLFRPLAVVNKILVIGIFVYWACGFAFAYGKNVVKNENGDYGYSQANQFMGHNYFFLIDDDKSHVKVSRSLIELPQEKN